MHPADQQKIVSKPWGHEVIFARHSKYVGKILHIKQGARLSLQYHRLKEETIYLAKGELLLEIEEEEGVFKHLRLKPGESHHIRAGCKHRMTAVETSDVFEVSTPEIEDVVRLEDDYGRA